MDAHIHSQNTGGDHRSGASLPGHSEGTAAHRDSEVGVAVQVSLIADFAPQDESGAHEPPQLAIVVPYSLPLTTS